MVLSPDCVQAEHPFPVVTEATFPALCALASQLPWSDMKTDASDKATNLTCNPGDDYTSKSLRMDNIVSACALAYILDPSTYLTKL